MVARGVDPEDGGTRPPAPSGVLVVDKPRGPTSHDVVMRLRRRLGTRQVGHAGTLDPMATGVLVVALGEGTKLLQWLTAENKAYEATIALGIETDTLDAEGREVRRLPPDADLLAALDESRDGTVSSRLRAALAQERARTTQIPPAYSAIRTDGERSFARARRGEAPVMEPRAVRVLTLDAVRCSREPPAVTAVVEATKGYYVRALGRDLAEALGTVGHLTSLRRLASGCFTIAEAASLELPDHELRAHVQPVAHAAARAMPIVELTDAGVRDAGFGRTVSAADLAAASVPPLIPCAWVDPTGELVAVGRLDEERRGHVLRGFVRPRAA